MAKCKLKIYPAAQTDMEQIFKYINEELCNPSAANDLINDFYKSLDNACMFPESCPLINNEYVKDRTLRKMVVSNYIIFYRVRGDEVQVVRVLYGMSDYKYLL
ncbi:MAG: type II toxin-antitoxin system RelE/ParE family toxin [Clostridia bacterium]|nr:type II toxin-antitoxin system RelE/ParE family toxin [Clostridia bacterium]